MNCLIYRAPHSCNNRWYFDATKTFHDNVLKIMTTLFIKLSAFFQSGWGSRLIEKVSSLRGGVTVALSKITSRAILVYLDFCVWNVGFYLAVKHSPFEKRGNSPERFCHYMAEGDRCDHLQWPQLEKFKPLKTHFFEI